METQKGGSSSSTPTEPQEGGWSSLTPRRHRRARSAASAAESGMVASVAEHGMVDGGDGKLLFQNSYLNKHLVVLCSSGSE